jgi:hypothetical protein
MTVAGGRGRKHPAFPTMGPPFAVAVRQKWPKEAGRRQAQVR